MRLRKIGERTLSDSLPGKSIKMTYNTVRVCNDLERFVNDYLRGAARIDVSLMPKGMIEISAQHLAYTLRQIVKYGCDDGIVEFEVKGEDRLEIWANFTGKIPDIRNLGDIFASARKAGLGIRLVDGRVLLYIDFRRTTVLPLYEPRFSTFIVELYNTFFD